MVGLPLPSCHGGAPRGSTCRSRRLAGYQGAVHPLILALLLSCGADPALTPLPGAPPPPAELAGQLLAARDALPPDARRTRHLAPDGLPRYTNRLALESSPYLRQHAHHPVDWRPWGPEAFA